MRNRIEKITIKSLSHRDRMWVENQATTKTPSRRDGMWVTVGAYCIRPNPNKANAIRPYIQRHNQDRAYAIRPYMYLTQSGQDECKQDCPKSCSSYNPENPDSDKNHSSLRGTKQSSVSFFWIASCLAMTNNCIRNDGQFFYYHNNHSNHINHSSDNGQSYNYSNHINHSSDYIQ
jgi:hypothetical protein